ncbi:MAG: tyrosine-type recombinase/integrase [Parcubacteria group bacterium]|nr:tyrosine-type recombinase/integrase [Parcubacteria group bacterium]
MSFLFDQVGKRKYLTIDERRAFLVAAAKSQPKVHTFCATLAYTGARISEVLALTPAQIDFSEGLIVIECLKKRRDRIYRSVPMPQDMLDLLDGIHKIRQAQQSPTKGLQRIWPWCRTTGWKHVKYTMVSAGLIGIHACPKGLRHGFGVSALQKSVPLNIVRKWLGHSRLSTTAIYGDAVGNEEREIASRFWNTF